MRRLGLLALCAVLASCGSATVGGSIQTPTPSEVASASGSPSSSPTTGQIAEPSPTPVCIAAVGTGTSRATITDVRVGSHPGYDRLVIEFSGGMPAYKLAAQDPSTFVGPASGIPVKVAGSAGFHLYIFNMDIPPTYQHGTNIPTQYPELAQVVVMGVYEGQADIAIGLTKPVCPVVSTLSNPSRLVIDFPVQ
jgi:hypothetical protein